MAIVIVGLSVLVVAGRMLGSSLGEPPVMSAAPTPTGTIRTISPPIDLPSGPPMTWSTVPAASSGKPAQLTGGGVQLRLPGGWHGRTTSEGGLLVLQAANFVLATHHPGEDPIQAMTREQVVVTLSTGTGCCPATPVSASPAIGGSDFLHDGRVPVGRALAVKAVRTHGSILSSEALFGARPPAPSLLRQTNHLLASLTVT
ncbi:MAG TPA: hypothetical protein VK942_11140 [Actinomycetes bacterium]|nr:hypothetical protein [Actinomycetes bacterium]